MKKRTLFMVALLSFMGIFAMLASACTAIPGLNQKTPSLEASITRTFTTGSYDGTKLLVIDLDVKNNTDTNLTAGVISFYSTATLDETVLVEGYIGTDNPNALPTMATIAPDSSGPSQLVYTLPDASEGTVELVITVDSTDYSDTIEIVRESIDLASVEALVSESEYVVVINNATVTDDGEGKSFLVLNITFTNNSDTATSFGSAIRTTLFQNNIALKTGYLPYNHSLSDSDLSGNSYNDIRQGASIDLQVVFELIDATSSVELTCVDAYSYDNAVILEKIIEISGS